MDKKTRHSHTCAYTRTHTHTHIHYPRNLSHIERYTQSKSKGMEKVISCKRKRKIKAGELG